MDFKFDESWCMEVRRLFINFKWYCSAAYFLRYKHLIVTWMQCLSGVCLMIVTWQIKYEGSWFYTLVLNFSDFGFSFFTLLALKGGTEFFIYFFIDIVKLNQLSSLWSGLCHLFCFFRISPKLQRFFYNFSIARVKAFIYFPVPGF